MCVCVFCADYMYVIVTWWGGPGGRTATSFGALTLLVGSFDLLKPIPNMTYNVFSGTFNPAQSANLYKCPECPVYLKANSIMLAGSKLVRAEIWPII